MYTLDKNYLTIKCYKLSIFQGSSFTPFHFPRTLPLIWIYFRYLFLCFYLRLQFFLPPCCGFESTELEDLTLFIEHLSTLFQDGNWRRWHLNRDNSAPWKNIKGWVKFLTKFQSINILCKTFALLFIITQAYNVKVKRWNRKKTFFFKETYFFLRISQALQKWTMGLTFF